MTQLETMKALLGSVPEADAVLTFYLDNAASIICDLRNTDVVETKHLTTQIKIAIELFNKRGAEGEIAHTENGIQRAYEKSDLSPSLLATIIPVATTPYSLVRVVT